MGRPTIKRNGVPLTPAERQQRARAKRQEIKHDKAQWIALAEIEKARYAAAMALLNSIVIPEDFWRGR